VKLCRRYVCLLQCVAAYCLFVATYCSVLQCLAVCCSRAWHCADGKSVDLVVKCVHLIMRILQYIYIYMYMYIYIITYTSISISIYVSIYMYIRIHIYICIYMEIYIYNTTASQTRT